MATTIGCRQDSAGDGSCTRMGWYPLAKAPHQIPDLARLHSATPAGPENRCKPVPGVQMCLLPIYGGGIAPSFLSGLGVCTKERRVGVEPTLAWRASRATKSGSDLPDRHLNRSVTGALFSGAVTARLAPWLPYSLSCLCYGNLFGFF